MFHSHRYATNERLDAHERLCGERMDTILRELERQDDASDAKHVENQTAIGNIMRLAWGAVAGIIATLVTLAGTLASKALHL